MVRVSGVEKRIVEAMKDDRTDETAQEQLRVIREELLRQLPLNDSCWNEMLEPALRKEGIKVLNYFELSKKEREKLRNYFERNIFPLLTPLGFDSGHPFPHISNLSLNLAVLIDDPDYGERFARVKIPPMFMRLIVVPEGDQEKITSSLKELKKKDVLSGLNSLSLQILTSCFPDSASLELILSELHAMQTLGLMRMETKTS